jgi:hypothetical protein
LSSLKFLKSGTRLYHLMGLFYRRKRGCPWNAALSFTCSDERTRSCPSLFHCRLAPVDRYRSKHNRDPAPEADTSDNRAYRNQPVPHLKSHVISLDAVSAFLEFGRAFCRALRSRGFQAPLALCVLVSPILRVFFYAPLCFVFTFTAATFPL